MVTNTAYVFTGLVETMGVLAERTARGPGARLVIRATLANEPLAMGESISVDGCCLSAVELGPTPDVAGSAPARFAVDATAETLARTTLGTLPVGKQVNLERAVRAGDRLGGHLVTGHVDAVGKLLERREVGEAVAMRFSLPAELARFVAEKGSVAVGGVSLTVNAVSAESFDVMIIPITLRVTTLGELAPGDPVNLEVDLVARYVARWRQ
ncbi:MAG TPA: riboflavin synthase [Polyangiaceae bacterium]|nr:riboflavin synthase [Polyangiaceae bacterium]